MKPPASKSALEKLFKCSFKPKWNCIYTKCAKKWEKADISNFAPRAQRNLDAHNFTQVTWRKQNIGSLLVPIHFRLRRFNYSLVICYLAALSCTCHLPVVSFVIFLILSGIKLVFLKREYKSGLSWRKLTTLLTNCRHIS